MNDNYFPVRLNTIRPNDIVTFDLYLNINQKLLHYLKKNDQFDEERLKNLRTKGLRKVYIKLEDENSYLSYLESGLNILNDVNQDMTKRGSVAHDSLITSAENAERTLETEHGYNCQKKQFEMISEFLTVEKGALKSILKAAGISGDTNHHAATVSSLALAVANKSGITDKVELFELGIAALLHDIGTNRLKFDPMKPMAKMTPDEVREFKNHPRDGADMLAGKPYISPRILGLISAHEEMGEGKGYPDKMFLSTKPLAYQILSMVNQFDHFATENQILPGEAIDPFFDKFGKEYDDQLINILATVLT